MTHQDAPENHVAAKHIVDILIEERAPALVNGPFWGLARPPLYAALLYDKARAMADAIAPLSGQAALDYVSALLHLRLQVRGLSRIPAQGRLVVVANHPTGIADGVAVYDALKGRRPDLTFFANADALRVSPGFADVLIPVEWVHAKRSHEKTKQTLRAAATAFAAERPLVIFPAGRLARHENGLIQDPPWESSAVSLARRNKAPIAPIHVAGPYPLFFHAFDRISKELRDITLFQELLNKAGLLYTVTIGPLIAPDALAGNTDDVTLRLKTYVERELAHNRDAEFSSPA